MMNLTQAIEHQTRVQLSPAVCEALDGVDLTQPLDISVAKKAELAGGVVRAVEGRWLLWRCE